MRVEDIGRGAGGEQAITLLATDPHLLGQGLLGSGGRVGHKGQGYAAALDERWEPPVPAGEGVAVGGGG